MTAVEALAIALHRTRHRVSEMTPEPCGSCRQEAASLHGAFPGGWLVVNEEAWRREQGSRSASERRYRAGLAEGAAQERARLREGIEGLLGS